MAENKLMNQNKKDLMSFGKSLREKYLNANPFPSIYMDDFFDQDFLKELLEEFPDLSNNADYVFNDANQGKLATKGEYKLGEKATELIRFMNSQPFLDFLTSITGIENLLPDPTLAGGGYHEIKPGGYLKVHADFNKHPDYLLDRRLNVLVYLNENWDESYGGNFELWNETMTRCEAKILPLFNRVAMFSTTSKSYHGHPNPLTCPEDRSRKSIALYYYTNGRPQHEVEEFLEDHSTIFKAREGVDNKEETEKYVNKRVAQQQKQRKKEARVSTIKSLVPPILWNVLKGSDK